MKKRRGEPPACATLPRFRAAVQHEFSPLSKYTTRARPPPPRRFLFSLSLSLIPTQTLPLLHARSHTHTRTLAHTHTHTRANSFSSTLYIIIPVRGDERTQRYKKATRRRKHTRLSDKIPSINVSFFFLQLTTAADDGTTAVAAFDDGRT